MRRLGARLVLLPSVGLVLLLLALVLFSGGAHAARLTLTGGGMFHSDTFAGCDTAVNVAVEWAGNSKNAKSVIVSNVHADCLNRELRIVVWDTVTGTKLLDPIAAVVVGDSVTFTFHPNAWPRTIDASVLIGDWPVSATVMGTTPHVC